MNESTGCGWALRQIALFSLAIWMGSTIGVMALATGMFVSGVRFQPNEVLLLLAGPAFLLTGWMWLNLPILIGGFVHMLRQDGATFKGWGIIVGLESLMVMLGWMYEFRSHLGTAVGWLVWLLLVAMMGTALWFIKQWLVNRWASELVILHAENATRRAELESHNRDDPGGE